MAHPGLPAGWTRRKAGPQLERLSHAAACASPTASRSWLSSGWQPPTRDGRGASGYDNLRRGSEWAGRLEVHEAVAATARYYAPRTIARIEFEVIGASGNRAHDDCERAGANIVG